MYYACPDCHGRFVGLGVLRKTLERSAVNNLWRSARDGNGKPARPCPVCAAAMTEVTTTGEQLHIDVCVRCHMMWFDGGELDAMPETTAPPPPPEMSPAARAALAIHKVEQIRREAETSQGIEGRAPDSMWKVIPSIFALPVEMDTRFLMRQPLVTWLFGLIALFAFISALPDLSQAIDRWGFSPGMPFRYGGMTMLTFMFMHGSWWQLLLNLYFLLIFGDDVEDYLGHARMMILLVAGGMSGCLFHAAAGVNPVTPLIGASGAISGVLCFYSLLHPHARIGFLIRSIYRVGWIHVSARAAFAGWILIQFLAMHFELQGFENVSAFAHLGGVLVGILMWVKWRDQ